MVVVKTMGTLKAMRTTMTVVVMEMFIVTVNVGLLMQCLLYIKVYS